MFKNVKQNLNDKLDSAQDMSQNAKRSGQDWLDYVMEHPVQSLMFGAVIGLAVRGFFKR